MGKLEQMWGKGRCNAYELVSVIIRDQKKKSNMHCNVMFFQYKEYEW